MPPGGRLESRSRGLELPVRATPGDASAISPLAMKLVRLMQFPRQRPAAPGEWRVKE
jgi:hypothetical protein